VGEPAGAERAVEAGEERQTRGPARVDRGRVAGPQLEQPEAEEQAGGRGRAHEEEDPVGVDHQSIQACCGGP
jgi:hypothetical protein